MKKFPKLRYPDDEEGRQAFEEGRIYIQEKIDGGNGRFMLQDHLDEQFHDEDRELVFGSRNVVYKNERDVSKQFAECIDYVRQNVDMDVLYEWDQKYERLVFFGEYMVPHTIQGYDWDEYGGTFVGFDIWNDVGEAWLGPPVSRIVFKSIGLPFAPILDHPTVEEFQDGNTALHNDEGEFVVPESDFGPVRAEGVVFKNPTTQTYAKYVRDGFKEKNKEMFNSKPGREEPDHEKLAYRYIPNARIEKQIHKLANEGGWDYTMEMMEDLPEAVIRDMAEEEGGEIFMGENYTVNLSDFRSHVSGRCARVLRQTINQRVQQGL